MFIYVKINSTLADRKDREAGYLTLGLFCLFFLNSETSVHYETCLIIVGLKNAFISLS